MRNPGSLIVALTALASFSAISGDVPPTISPQLLNDRWTASWIAPDGAPPFDCGVYHFRRTFDLPQKPASFVVHVTGDNRYQLYANGKRVVWGPARGDLFHWRFEKVDIASYLKPGKNVLAAVVWNYARNRYLDLLGEWDAMIARGLTTWAERPERASNPSRSDCHAWSAHPNFELFRTLLGIDSAAPGFAKVVIRPFMPTLKDIYGLIPHSKSEVSVRLKRSSGRLEAEVALPAGVTGQFDWHGSRRTLSPGLNRLEF